MKISLRCIRRISRIKFRSISIANALFLMRFGQPLLIGSGVALTSAIALLSTPMKATAESAYFYLDRGYKKMDSGDFAGGLSDFNQAIDLKPDYASAYLLRGTLKGILTDYLGALSDFEKVLELEPNNKNVFESMGITRVQLDDYQKAKFDFDKGIEFFPDKPSLYWWRARTNYSLGQIKSACNDLNQIKYLGGYENADDLYIKYNCGASVNKKTVTEMQSDCNDARDYEGCMNYQAQKATRSNQSNQSDSDCDMAGWCIAGDGKDILGMPKLKGWRYIQDPVNRRVGYTEHTTRKHRIGKLEFTLPKMYKVMVRGEYGRYIGRRRIIRWYQEYKAGTSARNLTLGNATTNCTSTYFGSGLNCTTTPANKITIPGKSAVPSGVRQGRIDVIIDCKDRTWAAYENNVKVDGWKKFESRSENGTLAHFFCKDGASKAGLPESDFMELAK